MSISKINNTLITATSKINNIGNYFINSDTKLLTKFNGVDGATSYTAETEQVATFVGSAQLDTAQKRFGLSSLLLNGSSDCVTIPDSDDWYFGTGDFTIDLWFRLASTTASQGFLHQFQNATNFWRIYLDSVGTLNFLFYYGGVWKGAYAVAIPSTSINVWHHLACERIGTTAKLFLDGVSLTLVEYIAFSTNDVGNISSVLNTGSAGGYLNGWIDAVRITKGRALWTTNFTPPIDIVKINNVSV